MPYLLPEREQEIAELLESYRGGSTKNSLDRGKFNQRWRNTLNARYPAIYRQFVADGPPPTQTEGTFLYGTWTIFALQQRGLISSREGEAWLTEKYPDYEWTNGIWDIDEVRDDSVKEAIDALNEPSEDPDAQTFPTQILGVQDARSGDDVFFGGPGGGGADEAAIYVDELPEEYAQGEVQSALASVAEQASLSIAQVANGAVRFRPNTVDGGALRPGSVTPAKLDQTAVAQFAREFPGEDQVVELSVARSNLIDRWAVPTAIANGTRGPQRVYEVTSVSLPTAYKPRPGPIRYRVVTRGLRFGIMSIDTGGGRTIFDAEDFNEVATVTYGCIIRNIPNFIGIGKIPTHMSAVSVGFPVGGSVRFADSVGSSFAFEEDYVLDAFENDAPRMYQPYNVTGGVSLALPSQTFCDTIEGMTFGLITGRTEREVFAQLNSKPASFGDYITGNSTGVVASLPDNLPYTAPFPASMTRWQSFSQSAGFNLVDEDFATWDKDPLKPWVRAAPMLHEDCGKLIATDSTFSLVIQLFPSLQLTQTEVANIGNPSSVAGQLNNWKDTGVEVVEAGRRQAAIDIIVA